MATFAPAALSLRFGPALGAGTFGEVFLAEMPSVLGPPVLVAVKVLRLSLDARAEGAARLRDEARLLMRLQHDHIPRVFELVELDGNPALVMEYVEGQDLARCFELGLPNQAVVRAIAGVASALDHAHNAVDETGRPLGLVHRDVKPENVRVTRNGIVKLLDFGVAKAVDSERSIKATSVVGSVGYMPPESFARSVRGNKAFNASAPARDVYALGVTLFEGLVGRSFFGELDRAEVTGILARPEDYAAYLAEQLGAMTDHVVGVVDLLRVMLAPDPLTRPTADEVARRCLRLAPRCAGEDLATWCREELASPPSVDRSTWPRRTLARMPTEPDVGEAGRTMVPAPEPVEVRSPVATPAAASSPPAVVLPAPRMAAPEPAAPVRPAAVVDRPPAVEPERLPSAEPERAPAVPWWAWGVVAVLGLLAVVFAGGVWLPGQGAPTSASSEPAPQAAADPALVMPAAAAVAQPGPDPSPDASRDASPGASLLPASSPPSPAIAPTTTPARAPSTTPPAAVRAEAPTPSAPISASTSAPEPVAASPAPQVAPSSGGRAHLRVVFNPKATDPVWRARGASGGLGSGAADVPVGKVTLSWRTGTGEWESASTTTVDVPAGGGSFVCRGSGASARCVPQ